MVDFEAELVDLRPIIKGALSGIVSETPFTVRERWGHAPVTGVTITYAEKENRSTECPVVDFLSYQVDVWAPERAQVTELSGLVNAAMLELGLKRLSRAESVTGDGLRCCEMVFGRKLDKRWGRFID